jgi:hypothetical protein
LECTAVAYIPVQLRRDLRERGPTRRSVAYSAPSGSRSGVNMNQVLMFDD